MNPKSGHHIAIQPNAESIDSAMTFVRQHVDNAYSVKIWFHGDKAALVVREKDTNQRWVRPQAIQESGDWISLPIVKPPQLLSAGTHKITCGDKRGTMVFILNELSAALGIHFTVEALY